MASSTGPNIATDGLVLALDAANIKSFRGEPTTNVVTNTNLDTGWSKGYQTNIVFNEIDPPIGIDSPVVGHDRGQSSGYWYSYGDYAPQVPNTVYTVSLYVKTLDSNFNIRFYTANNSETGRVYGSYIQVPNDGKWHRIVWNSFTNPSNSQSDSLSFQFTYAGAIGSSTTRTWFCAPQMEAKSYATPFVIGTRGATVATGGGWADLSGNTNHGELVNGVGYDSGNGGSLVFDGSSGYVSKTGMNYIPYCIDIWFFNNDTILPDQISGANYQQLLGLGNYPGGVTLGRWTSLATNETISFWSTNYASNGMTYIRDTITVWWHNLIINWNGSSYDIWLDGSKKTTYPSSDGHCKLESRDSIFIGKEDGSASYEFNGKIASYKTYNRALTDSEVLQNFNATRGRFGI